MVDDPGRRRGVDRLEVAEIEHERVDRGRRDLGADRFGGGREVAGIASGEYDAGAVNSQDTGGLPAGPAVLAMSCMVSLEKAQ